MAPVLGVTFFDATLVFTEGEGIISFSVDFGVIGVFTEGEVINSFSVDFGVRGPTRTEVLVPGVIPGVIPVVLGGGGGGGGGPRGVVRE